MAEIEEVRHVLEAQQFDRSWIEGELFPRTEEMAAIRSGHLSHAFRNRNSQDLAGKSVCVLFVEPSTRTRLSFQQAANFLGATVVATENAKEVSSMFKGESVEDTVRTVNALEFDVIVTRTATEGDAKKAASVSRVPVINAGDGVGQHPTQALLDLYTLRQEFGRLDDLRVGLVGDLKNGRTARSLAYLLGKFDSNKIFMVAPPEHQMRDDILDYLGRHNVRYEQVDKLSEIARWLDVVYLTRLQTERQGNHSQSGVDNGQDVRLNDAVLEQLPPRSIIMHPLPRSDAFGELLEKYTDDPRVVIFKQVKYGLYTRMALLSWAVHGNRYLKNELDS